MRSKERRGKEEIGDAKSRITGGDNSRERRWEDGGRKPRDASTAKDRVKNLHHRFAKTAFLSYLCNGRGSTWVLPFLLPDAGEACHRAQMTLQKGLFELFIRPKRAAKCGPCALSFGPNENKTLLLWIIQNDFSRI